MRKIREVLRLHYSAGLSIRAIARSLKASPSTVREYILRAQEQGLAWPLPESLDDAQLERRRLPGAAAAGRDPVPGAGLEPGSPRASPQRGDPRAAVAGVQGGASPGDAVQRVLRAVPSLDGEARRGDAPGTPRRGEEVRRLRGADGGGGGARHRRASRGAGLRRGARGVERHLRRGDLDADAARRDRVARARVPFPWRM